MQQPTLGARDFYHLHVNRNYRRRRKEPKCEQGHDTSGKLQAARLGILTWIALCDVNAFQSKGIMKKIVEK